jgi:hypothetical protein
MPDGMPDKPPRLAQDQDCRPLQVWRHALRPKIKHISSHLENRRDLVEQVIGRFAAVTLEVIEVRRRQRLTVAIFKQRGHLFLADTEILAGGGR